MKKKRVAIVHDWLYTLGGAEVVLKHLLRLFPDADLYTLVDTLEENEREFLKDRKIFSFFKPGSFASRHHTLFMPFMPYCIEQFDLSEYDLVISSSHFVAKGVLTHPNQLHIAYIYSPVRYAWDMYFEYDRSGAFGKGLQRILTKFWLHRLRIWDVISAKRADYLLADSIFVQKRIKKYWDREATVIYPPVEIEYTIYEESKEEYYVTMSRLIEYKKIDLIIECFNDVPEKKLYIIGSGREERKLKSMAKENIVFTGYLPKKESMQIISKAKAFVFMAKEDFGIVPIEAQACGTPVIAYKEGGVKESVVDGVTGIYVEQQNKESLKLAIARFESSVFDPKACKKQAQKFGSENFCKQFEEYVENALRSFNL